jgi:hypothetical protein
MMLMLTMTHNHAACPAATAAAAGIQCGWRCMMPQSTGRTWQTSSGRLWQRSGGSSFRYLLGEWQ